ncbi:MAG: hypothetical protein M1836_002862 [Candelina mexicana]|nr:MAG: hypothetical protein M1836_002862 [Candelina mexicana]
MALLASFTWLGFGTGCLLCSLIYIFALILYRLWLSPISSFPGPFLARITFMYEFYYQWFGTGTYYLKIKEMHDKYGKTCFRSITLVDAHALAGPIVRVTPEELHISEPSFYRKLFVSAAVRKTENYPRFSEGTGFEDMTAISTHHEAHRRARAPLEPFFSTAGITRTEARVVARVKKLCQRVNTLKGSGNVINFSYALSSLTTDVISSVIFEESSDYLGAADFNVAWFDTLKRGTLTHPLFAHLPLLAKSLSTPVIRALTENATNWRMWDDKGKRQILSSRLRPSDEAKTREDTTVLDHLVHNDSGLSEDQYGQGGFVRVAQLIQQAGSHNVSHALATILVYILLDEEKHQTLRKELESVFVDESETLPSSRDLQKLPYLSSVIKEGLSLVYMTMYHTIAHLFRPGAPRITLYETDGTDVVAVHGLLFPLPRLNSKGVRALIG